MSSSRHLAAIMFTDIVGYTALMGNDEQKAFELLNKNRELQKPIIEQYNGRWIKELGDGVMASFNTVSDAVNSAIKIQEACNTAKDFQLRIGIHLGEVVFENDDVFGDGVNIASRIQSAAKPGCIYVSESVQNNVSNKKDIQTKFVKEETLKNVKEPVKMYEIITANSITLAPEKQKENIIQNSIAVLPFANMSSDPEQEFFSDGISEEIINMLAQVPGLKVAGRTSSFSFKGKSQDLRIIGEQLNVNHILEGSVRKSGNKLRITAQLIKVADGYHLWSEKYDRQLEDIFDIQDEISLAILNAIKIKLLDAEKRNLLKRYTDNPEAYQLYLQGRYHMNQFSGADALKNGIRYYEEAIKIEPEYALAYAGIASSYLNLWLFNYLPNEQSLPQMKQAVEGAMKLDNEIAESHYALGNLKFWYEWDCKDALPLYQKAIEINPNMAEAHVWYAHCLNAIGQHTKGFEHAAIAYNLDPFSLINNFYVGWGYLHAGHYEKAQELGKRMIELEPAFYSGHTIAGTALMVQKKYEEAQAELEIAAKLNYSFLTLGQMGVLYGMMGNEAKAQQILEEIEVLSKTQPLSNYDKGFVHIFIGEYELAAMHFEKGIELRQGLMIVAKDYLLLLDKKQYVPQIAEVLKKLEVFKRNY
jgi:serine/threonine-protein kinase